MNAVLSHDEDGKDWCEQALAGDHEAACRLIEHYYQRIYAYLRRLTGSEEMAADLTQQTFSRAWQSLAKYRGASSVSTWLHRIAYCTYVDWVRKEKPVECPTDQWWNAVPAHNPSPVETVADEDFSRQLFILVEDLKPENRRIAVHLHYYQNLTLVETAEVMDLPLSTLKYQLKSALDELKTTLNQASPKWF
jgi:RNA polymerase sigma factor (sigma-70 family)